MEAWNHRLYKRIIYKYGAFVILVFPLFIENFKTIYENFITDGFVQYVYIK